MRKNLAYQLALFCVGGVIILTAASCSDSDDDNSGALTRTYYYSTVLPNADDEQYLVLDSLQADVSTIANTPQWLTVSQSGQEDGHPVLSLKTSPTANDAVSNAKVLLTLADGNQVELNVALSYLYQGGSNSNDDFSTNWEAMDKVTIYTNHNFETVYTPWNKTYVSTTIPLDISRDVCKKDGWEMVFNTLGDPNIMDANYFGLYNRYLGILRIFYYITDATGNGSELSFATTMGSANKTKTKTPYFNALTYGIPMNLTSQVQLSTNVTGSNKSFFTYATPYSISGIGGNTLTRGWGAFDLNMSAYTGNASVLQDANESLSIECSTINNAQISLSGSLSANVVGEYTQASTVATSSADGIGSTLASMGSFLGDVRNSALAGIEKALTGSYTNTAFYYAGMICNGASMVADYIMADRKIGEDEIDSIPGKINLNLTGKIDLSGYSKARVQNNVPSLSVMNSVMKVSGSHIGEGVWSLQESPVVYVVDDHYMGSFKSVNLILGEQGEYKTVSSLDQEMRLVTFYDPSSIKLNINTNVFPDISDVNIYTFVAVYPDEDAGHTQGYRSMMKLANAPTINLVDPAKFKQGSIYRSGNASNRMKYHYAELADFITEELEETASNCSIVKQSGSNYRYYGHLLSGSSKGDKKVIVDPQVLFPTSADNRTIYNGQVPDFVVCVYLTFKSNGRQFTFSHRFLPEYKLISGNDLKTKKAALESYSAKCKNKESVGTLNNNAGVGFTNINGHHDLARTLKILKTITE